MRESGAEFGMAIGRGDDVDEDVIVDVQIAATGEVAASLVAVVQEWHREWVDHDDRHLRPGRTLTA